MALLLLLVSGLPVGFCFAEFVDGDTDTLIQPYSFVGVSSYTDTYNFPDDTGLFCYGRSFPFQPVQGDVATGGTGSDYPSSVRPGFKVPVFVSLKFTNNTDFYYDISSVTFSLHMKEALDFNVSLTGISVDDWRVASIARPSAGKMYVQQITLVPGSGVMTLQPGQTYTLVLDLSYFLNTSTFSSSAFYDSFDVVSFAAVKVDDVDNSQGATAGGQQQIIDNIQNQYDTNSGQQDAITGDVNTAISGIENIGLFSFLIDFSKQFVGVFSSGDDSTSLTLPGFSITVDGEQLTVWEAHTFDFATMEGPFAVLLAALRLGTSVVVIGALISYLFGLYEHIFAGGEQY